MKSGHGLDGRRGLPACFRWRTSRPLRKQCNVKSHWSPPCPLGFVHALATPWAFTLGQTPEMTKNVAHCSRAWVASFQRLRLVKPATMAYSGDARTFALPSSEHLRPWCWHGGSRNESLVSLSCALVQLFLVCAPESCAPPLRSLE